MGQAALTTPLAQAVVTGRDSSILDEIWSPDSAAVIWERNPSSQFQEWIDTLPPGALPKARLALRPDDVEDAIAAICAERGVPSGPQCDTLAGDIGLLAKLFARIMAVPLVHLRLDVVNNNACSKFHIDNVPARLLCTYRGRGTEYGRSLAGEEPVSVQSVATGSVGLFRGRRWSSPERSVVTHRSPPISGLGETRLLLVIDAPLDED